MPTPAVPLHITYVHDPEFRQNWGYRVTFYWRIAQAEVGADFQQQWLDISVTPDIEGNLGTPYVDSRFVGGHNGVEPEHQPILDHFTRDGVNPTVPPGTYWWRVNTKIDGIWYPSAIAQFTLPPLSEEKKGISPLLILGAIAVLGAVWIMTRED